LEDIMEQSISSTGGGHKKQGAADRKNQPSTNGDQRLSDQDGFVQPSKTKPDGGAEQGARSTR
jgi:hypothetical protein